MLLIEYAAPFAAFREMAAGPWRPSMPFTPYSTLYGLIHNLAGVQMEQATELRIASAALRWPHAATLYQQLHVMPVGESANHAKPRTKGNKHHITPARRQLLCDLAGICALDAPDLEPRLRQALTTGLSPRRGVPFLGDNNLFLERAQLLTPDERQVHWLVPSGPAGFPLTLWIDQDNSAHTRTAHFRLQKGQANQPPPTAWQLIGPG